MACTQIDTSGRARDRELWGGWSVRFERKADRPWGFGLFRVVWLGVTVIVIGRLVITLTRPVAL